MALHFDDEQFQDFSSFTRGGGGRGSGGLPPEAEAFSESLDDRWAISRLHPSHCVILQHQRGEGVRGLAPWSWSIFWGSRCQMSNFKTFQPSECVILQHRSGEGVRGLAPWSWSIFWVSRCQMSNFKTFHPSRCVILQHEGGEGVMGLAPWSWSIFWVSRFQMILGPEV